MLSPNGFVVMKPVERLASFYFIVENNDLKLMVKMMAG
ncbi:hypothetical protein L291_3745 [Acinetobacter guillouiae MSP4-18]|nr:hypothetical protein L291_3745 [Acinetobacter guillouiae MSP4-18]